MATPLSADVAELADAQVSEACDGDIVEVQVLSSAPGKSQNRNAVASGPEEALNDLNRTRRYRVSVLTFGQQKKLATESIRLVFS